jgi:hypothetical protein
VQCVVVVVGWGGGGCSVGGGGGGGSSVWVGSGCSGRAFVVVVVVVVVVVFDGLDLDGRAFVVVTGASAGLGCASGGTGSTAARSSGVCRWFPSLTTPTANIAAVTAPMTAPTATRP